MDGDWPAGRGHPAQSVPQSARRPQSHPGRTNTMSVHFMYTCCTCNVYYVTHLCTLYSTCTILSTNLPVSYVTGFVQDVPACGGSVSAIARRRHLPLPSKRRRRHQPAVLAFPPQPLPAGRHRRGGQAVPPARESARPGMGAQSAAGLCRYVQYVLLIWYSNNNCMLTQDIS